MYKKELGISLYPEHFTIEETQNYIDNCAKKGIKKAFLSLIHLGNPIEKKILEQYDEIIKYCIKKEIYVIVDINDTAIEAYKANIKNFNAYSKLGINCLRLDSPLMAENVANATFANHKLDYQINVSRNDSFVSNIMDFKPDQSKLFGCHNFYPLHKSGLPLKTFTEANNKFLRFNVHLSAFVGSNFGTKGPQKFDVGPLVSLEMHRNLPIRTQAKHMFATEQISTVFVGNQPMSEIELKEFSDTHKLNKLQLDIEISKNISDIEKKILKYDNHFRRGDITNEFVRSTYTRVDFKGNIIKPNNTSIKFNRGDVVIINSNNSHYQNELLIILKDNYVELGNTANLVAKIKNYDQILIDYIDAWKRFEFREV